MLFIGRFSGFLLALCMIMPVPVLNAQTPIIIDHTCTDLSAVPQYWIDQAKAQLLVGYGHTSHGSQLVTGVRSFRGDSGSPYYFEYTSWGLSPGIFLNDYWGNAGGASDLGHNGYLGWRDATVTMLGNQDNDRNVVIWSWCGGCSDNTEAGINIYLDAMDQLEADYPGVTFIYMTGHLDIWSDTNLKARNQQIRDYCIANDKILFDFADIESYNPDSTFFEYATDTCNYYDDAESPALLGNWADEWIAANPTHELTTIAAGCSDCAHSRRLNCVMKGRAFWWMMARIAGWAGEDTTPTPTPEPSDTPLYTPTPLPTDTPTSYPTDTPTPLPTDSPTPFLTDTPIETPTPTMPPCINHGDVNSNGSITAQDAQMTFAIAIGSLTPTYEEECAADCTGDGSVTAEDAQKVFARAIGAGVCADPIPDPS